MIGSSSVIKMARGGGKALYYSLARNGIALARKNAPIILTGVSIGGVVLTAALAIDATPKALDILEEERCIRYSNSLSEEEPMITKWEKLKLCWKPYIPAIITGGLTIASIAYSSNLYSRRNAALALSLTCAEKALLDYKNKVIAEIGTEKNEKIMESIEQDHINEHSKNEEPLVVTANNGDVLCYDQYSDRYFYSNYNAIRKAENEINKNLLTDMFVTVNEVYSAISAYSSSELKAISSGWDSGWDINRDGYVDIGITSMISENDVPCLSINFRTTPKPKYR